MQCCHATVNYRLYKKITAWGLMVVNITLQLQFQGDVYLQSTFKPVLSVFFYTSQKKIKEMGTLK